MPLWPPGVNIIECFTCASGVAVHTCVELMMPCIFCRLWGICSTELASCVAALLEHVAACRVDALQQAEWTNS